MSRVTRSSSCRLMQEVHDHEPNPISTPPYPGEFDPEQSQTTIGKYSQPNSSNATLITSHSQQPEFGLSIISKGHRGTNPDDSTFNLTAVSQQPKIQGFYSKFYNSRLHIIPKRTALSIVITPCGTDFQSNPALAGSKFRNNRRLHFGHVEQLTFPTGVPPGTLHKLKLSNDVTQTTYDSMGNSFHCQIEHFQPAQDLKPYKIDIDALLSLEWEGKPVDIEAVEEPKKRVPRQRRNSLDLTAHRLQQLRSGVSDEQTGNNNTGNDDLDDQDEDDEYFDSNNNNNNNNQTDTANPSLQAMDNRDDIDDFENTTGAIQSVLMMSKQPTPAIITSVDSTTASLPVQQQQLPPPMTMPEVPELRPAPTITTMNASTPATSLQPVQNRQQLPPQQQAQQPQEQILQEQSTVDIIPGPMTRRRRTIMALNLGTDTSSPSQTRSSSRVSPAQLQQSQPQPPQQQTQIQQLDQIKPQSQSNSTVEITASATFQAQQLPQDQELQTQQPNPQTSSNLATMSLSTLLNEQLFDLKPLPVRTPTVQQSTHQTSQPQLQPQPSQIQSQLEKFIQPVTQQIQVLVNSDSNAASNIDSNNGNNDLVDPYTDLNISASSTNSCTITKTITLANAIGVAADLPTPQQDLIKANRIKDETIRRLKSDCIELSQNITKLTAQYESSRSENTSLTATIVNLETKLKVLQDDLVFFKDKQQEQPHPTLTQSSQQQQLQQQLQLHQQQLQQHDDDHTKELTELEASIEIMKQACRSKSCRGALLVSKDLAKKDKQIQLNTNHIKDFTTKVTDLTNELESYRISTVQLNTQNQELVQQNGVLEGVISQLKLDLETAQQESNSTKSDQDCQSLVDETVLHKKDSEITLLRAQMAKLQSQLNAKDSLLMSQQRELEGLRPIGRIVDEIKDERDDKHIKIIELTKTIVAKESQINSLEQTMTRYQSELESFNTEIENLQEQIEGLELGQANNGQQYQIEITNLHKAHQTATSSQQKQLIAAKNTITDLTTQLIDLETELDDIKRHVDDKCDYEDYNQVVDKFRSNLHTTNSSRCWNRVICSFEQSNNGSIDEDDNAETTISQATSHTLSLSPPHSSSAQQLPPTSSFDQIITSDNQQIDDLVQMAALGDNISIFTTSPNTSQINNQDAHLILSRSTNKIVTNAFEQLFTTLNLVNKSDQNPTNSENDCFSSQILPKQVHLAVYEVHMERLRDLLGFVPMQQLEELVKTGQKEANANKTNKSSKAMNDATIQVINTTYGKNYDPNDCRLVNTTFSNTTTGTSTHDNGISIGVDGRRVPIFNSKQATECVLAGLANRMTNSDNNRSSHIIIQVYMTDPNISNNPMGDEAMMAVTGAIGNRLKPTMSILSIIDLAHGFPLQASHNLSPAFLQEMQCITTSLTALTSIMGQLSEHKQQLMRNDSPPTSPISINYRLSKLTMLLKDTLTLTKSFRHQLYPQVCTVFNLNDKPRSFYETTHIFKLANRFYTALHPTQVAPMPASQAQNTSSSFAPQTVAPQSLDSTSTTTAVPQPEQLQTGPIKQEDPTPSPTQIISQNLQPTAASSDSATQPTTTSTQLNKPLQSRAATLSNTTSTVPSSIPKSSINPGPKPLVKPSTLSAAPPTASTISGARKIGDGAIPATRRAIGAPPASSTTTSSSSVRPSGILGKK